MSVSNSTRDFGIRSSLSLKGSTSGVIKWKISRRLADVRSELCEVVIGLDAYGIEGKVAVVFF